jgi:YfiH family protein
MSMLYSSDCYTIYFGNKAQAVPRALFSGVATQQELVTHPVLSKVKDMLGVTILVFAQQIHSARGYAVTSDTEYKFMFAQPEGDFLITNKPGVGLGIYTADCVPIVFYDQKQQCIGICHAGWVGSVQHVAVATLDALIHEYKCQVQDITVFFGPAARGCCYTVGPDCTQKIPQEYLRKSHTLYYCDLVEYNQAQLYTRGIERHNMHTQFALCTIENSTYCSYRRDKQTSMRQVTVIALRA